MTTYKTTRAGADYQAFKPTGGGYRAVAVGSVVLGADLGTTPETTGPLNGDIYHMCKLPKGAVVFGGRFKGSRIASGTSAGNHADLEHRADRCVHDTRRNVLRCRYRKPVFRQRIRHGLFVVLARLRQDGKRRQLPARRSAHGRRPVDAERGAVRASEVRRKCDELHQRKCDGARSGLLRPVNADPKIQCKMLDSICVVDAEGRKSNLASVQARGFPLVKQLPERSGQLAIVASGPSLRDCVDELVEWPGEVWAINGAYDYLLDNNITPQGFFAIDPLPGLAEYLESPNAATTFYLASTCDPSVFDALKGHKVQTFHAAGEDMEYPRGEWQVGGGTTAMTRAPYLGLLQGWRDITIYGADSSFAGREYCYKWGTYACDIATPKVWVDVKGGDGRAFETELGLLKQVSQLGVLHTKFGNAEVSLRRAYGCIHAGADHG